MKFSINPAGPERRLLDRSRRTRAMSWIMAIMLFLTVLAGALGLGMFAARGSLDRQLAGRLTVQIVEPDEAARDRDTRAMADAFRKLPAVKRVEVVDRERLAELVRPWLGDAGLDPDLPMPAMIDVDLSDASDAAVSRVESAAREIYAEARVDRHAQWLSPIRGFMTTLSWLAIGLVLLMASATAAVVLLVARSGLDTHRDTIEVLHMLGATDLQVARLFQRRIAFDTLLGGLVGTGLAMALVAFLQSRLGMLGSEMLSGVALHQRDWFLLLILPILFALMATFAARVAVLGALRRIL
ncbi:cell division protein FtsX [Stakelama tenebrarum]|uniref:Permease n=1 Tax=Stakelama tenebrarum TaxID=2711215 RepID=A0A6G6Y1I6_9SPHN|nr:FtsX-like permease family protein [Sphingosinithalassobacter tenebrarum]QIG78473.1 permease [Sphingosinithalassobacter tenebrarum]